MVLVGGALKPVTGTVHYPPNVQACIFWLRHRRPATWGDRAAAPADAGDDPFAAPYAATGTAYDPWK